MNKEQIKQARLDAGMTQSEYAENIGVSLRTYAYYEAGEKPIPKTVSKLINAYSRIESLLIQLSAKKY